MFVEQPLAYDDIEGLKKLARGDQGADRHRRRHPFARRYHHPCARAGAGGVSLKLIKLGGITAAVEAGELCQRLGLSVNIAAKIAKSSISSAAALHLACAVPKADWGVSLTHFYLAEDIVRRPLPLADGRLRCRPAPASASRSTRPRERRTQGAIRRRIDQEGRHMSVREGPLAAFACSNWRASSPAPGPDRRWPISAPT